MKRILLLSDSHGNVDNMVEAVREVNPDMIFHMGDCWNDAVRLEKRINGIPIEKVTGNCDWGQGEEEKMVAVEGIKILICHGHAYGVKRDLMSLDYAAREKGADVAVFGHTHRVFYDCYNGLWLINPGSIGAPPYNVPPSYAVLTIGGKEEISLKTFYLDDCRSYFK